MQKKLMSGWGSVISGLGTSPANPQYLRVARVVVVGCGL
jgi:hypothetical protein